MVSIVLVEPIHEETNPSVYFSLRLYVLETIAQLLVGPGLPAFYGRSKWSFDMIASASFGHFLKTSISSDCKRPSSDRCMGVPAAQKKLLTLIRSCYQYQASKRCSVLFSRYTYFMKVDFPDPGFPVTRKMLFPCCSHFPRFGELAYEPSTS